MAVPSSEPKISVTPLSQAVLSGDLERVKVALANGGDPRQDDGGVFRAAVKAGNLDMVREMWERDKILNPTKQGPDSLIRMQDNYALISAMEQPQDSGLWALIKQVIAFLLGNGADATARGNQSIELASAQPNKPTNLEAMKMLKDKGGDINAAFTDRVNTNGTDGWPSSPLAAAVRYGDKDGVKGLIEMGADVNANDGLAMMQAINNGDMAMVKMLHEQYRADLNVGNGNPLGEAVAVKNVEIARYILEQTGAKDDPALANGPGNYNVISAVSNKDPAMVRLLAEYGADMNQQGGQALIRAIEMQDAATVKALIVGGADPNLKDSQALKQAVSLGNPEILKALIEGGADVSKIDMDMMDGALWEKHPEVREAIYDRVAHPEDAGKPLGGVSVLAEERALQGKDQAPAAVEKDASIRANIPTYG